MRHTAHPLEGLNLKKLTTPTIGQDVEKLELSYIAGGTEKWHKLFGKQFGNF